MTMEELLRSMSLSLYSSGHVTMDQLREIFIRTDRRFIDGDELKVLEDRVEALESAGVITPENKEKLDTLPQFTGTPQTNGVTVKEDGSLEVSSITPDKLETEGFTFVLDGGASLSPGA